MKCQVLDNVNTGVGTPGLDKLHTKFLFGYVFLARMYFYISPGFKVRLGLGFVVEL